MPLLAAGGEKSARAGNVSLRVFPGAGGGGGGGGHFCPIREPRRGGGKFSRAPARWPRRKKERRGVGLLFLQSPASCSKRELRIFRRDRESFFERRGRVPVYSRACARP